MQSLRDRIRGNFRTLLYSLSACFLLLFLAFFFARIYFAPEKTPVVHKFKGLSLNSQGAAQQNDKSDHNPFQAYSPPQLLEVEKSPFNPSLLMDYGLVGTSHPSPPGQKSYVQVTFGWKNSCNGAPLTYIKRHIRSQKTFFLTLEPLISPTPNFVSQVHEVSREDILNGFKLNLELPDTEEVLNLGLFLCSDIRGERSCKNKTPLRSDILRLPPANRKRVDYEVSSFDSDAIYFFGYVHSRWRSFFSFQNQPRSLSLFDVRKMLEKSGVTANDIGMILSRLQYYYERTKPEQLSIAGRRVNIYLPINLDQNCKDPGW